MSQYSIVAKNPESTVVSEYTPPVRRERGYQSEAALEKEFIDLLKSQAYEYLSVKDEAQLVANLKVQLEKLNRYEFTFSEWKRFLNEQLSNPNLGIAEKSEMIHENYILPLTQDDGTIKNIYIIDKDNIHNNSLQVINQYATSAGQRENRYDVTILVNGFPMVHIELKRRGVPLVAAFDQIDRYCRESFWAGAGLYEYIQLFVISNGTHTKYYSNSTREAHIEEVGRRSGRRSRRGKATSHSFEFTSWWADANNRPIPDLIDFGKTFFAKHALLNILTKYCVFTSEKILMVMRPYQIVAAERIISKINISQNYKQYGSTDGGGYIWHTTGSGKTLTSFKAAQIASKLPYISKVLFVVDRKDLDHQTMQEYDKFEKGAANSNSSTNVLKRQLEDPNVRIIITTIQKLSILVGREKGHPIYNERVVIIFDECHRSQFGEMHRAITKSFKKYNLFGFTGTPIFAKNAPSSGLNNLKTTTQSFGEQLHTYTIVDAINDRNVLPFRIDYVRTMREEENIADVDVWDIDREKALMAPERISNVVGYILENFNRKTNRNEFYEVGQRRLAGFNSIFAVSSIAAAKLYYNEFQRQISSLPSDRQLKVATIYSFGVNDPIDESLGLLDDENLEGTANLNQSDRDFLESAMDDYNALFSTNFDTSSRSFQNYYVDLSTRMKNRELDLLIVVNMFLTGFDAKTLNTLWVDKNLRLHGLLQAYSRTNRILNKVKAFGNIVCFRNLEEATNESIGIFGDKEASGLVLLKSFEDYYNGFVDGDKKIVGYVELIEELKRVYPLDLQIVGEGNEREFIKLFGALLRLKNILVSFDEFEGKEILSPREFQDYQSIYIDLYQGRSGPDPKGTSEDIIDDLIFEMELIKQVEINIDYILGLVNQFHDSNLEDKEIVVSISKAIDSTLDLRNKKDLILQFIDSLTPTSDVSEDWHSYIEKRREEEFDAIIREEKLNSKEAYSFIDRAFKDGYLSTTGTAFARVLPSLSRFTPDGERHKTRERVIDKLIAFFNRFWEISSSQFKI